MVHSLCGYNDELTFKDLSDEDIDYVQTHNREKTVSKVDGKVNPVLFLGPYYHESPATFEFNRGERKKLHQVATLMKKYETEKLADRFAMGKFKIDHRQMIFNEKTKGWYFGKPLLAECDTSHKSGTVNNSSDANVNTLQTSLHRTLKTQAIKLGVSDEEAESMLSGNLSVNMNGNEVRGHIACGWCKQNQKDSVITVSSKSVDGPKKSSTYWISSNFTIHFKRYHKKDIAMAESINSIEQDVQKHSIASNTTLQSSADSEPKLPSAIEKNFNDEVDVEMTEAPKTEEILPVQSFITLEQQQLERLIFSQISKQMANMSNAAQLDEATQNYMHFNIGKDSTLLKVLQTIPDGSCLFQALAHQLFQKEIDSKEHKADTKALRKNVVAEIKNNVDKYKLQLNNTVFDQLSETEINSLKTLSKDHRDKKLASLRHNFLHKKLVKAKAWGGSESLTAASILHRVNLLIFSEDESFQLSHFDQSFDAIVCVAYRKGRNHYDSVVSINQEDVFGIAKKLAERKIAENEIETIDDDYDPNRIFENN